MRTISLDYIHTEFNPICHREYAILNYNKYWILLYRKIELIQFNSWSFKEGFTRETAIL